MTVKDYFEQALSFLGWTANVPNNTGWRNNEDLTFDKDYDIPNPRLSQLANKDTQQLPTIPKFKEPNESDEEFNKTVEFVRNIKFADAHVFQYSQRRGTPAAKRPNQISPDVKEKRSKIIIAETQKTRDEFINRFIGKTMRVLFEQPAKDRTF